MHDPRGSIRPPAGPQGLGRARQQKFHKLRGSGGSGEVSETGFEIRSLKRGSGERAMKLTGRAGPGNFV